MNTPRRHRTAVGLTRFGPLIVVVVSALAIVAVSYTHLTLPTIYSV